ncbi:MAG: alpha/beta hydrolase [Chloroflexi bacterium]|nr:alpha/beta hydrolase [Chloroflexota bacterium]
MPDQQSNFAAINGTQIYHELAGSGPPLVMIHAGVADNRQWNNEFAHFAEDYTVLRYDLRGYGQSEPVDGEFSHMTDLVALLDHVGFDEPLNMMGCSMGGGLAMDFALTYPERIKALIMVGSGPSGLKLDVPAPEKFADAEKAYEAGNWDLLAEIETQIWFDGSGRSPEDVNQAMRKLAYDMNRNALTHEAKQLGKRLPDTQTPAAERLSDLNIPVLVIVGEHDTSYILTAADYMVENIASARKMVMEDAAHLPNMDHPQAFRQAVEAFLANAASAG